jgi:hypothetical protein
VATVSSAGVVTGVAAGTATITVTTADGNKTATCTVTVTAATTYSITASPASLPFGSLQTPYTQPTAQTVTITNTGSGTVTLNALTAVTNYTLTALSTTTLAAGGTATFTVRPNAGLPVGTYNATINITGSNSVSAQVQVSFAVSAAAGVAPTIPTGQPADKSVTVGQTVTFTCAATGAPAPTYQWELQMGTNWYDLSVAPDFSGAKTGTLSFTPKDVGTGTVIIRCVASNGILPDAISRTVTITVTAGAPFDGSGTSGSPWLIKSADDLKKLSELINAGTAPYADAGKYYRLENNITMPTAAAGSLGNHTPIGIDGKPFKGYFNGNNKTINVLTINNAPKEYIGLFGYVSGGTIQNLGLTNVSIVGGTYTGGIAGSLEGSGANITGCFVTGSVTGNWYVGGIVGNAARSSVSNCYTTCSVSGKNISVGGIVGSSEGNISKCYATGAISGSSKVGGIAGTNSNSIYGKVEYCVALNVSVNRTSGSETDFGRVVGYNESTSINNSAFSGMTTNSGVSLTTGDKNGTAIDKTAAKSQSTYIGRNWGFGATTASPWKWPASGALLPIFHWQTTFPITLPAHLN